MNLLAKIFGVKPKPELKAPAATYFPLPPAEMERFNKAITREGEQQLEQPKKD